MRVNRQFILVRIDKAAQLQKREKVGNIYISPMFAYMAHNLQYGEIVQIGEKAQRNYPDAAIGDIAIFHHLIEGSNEDPAYEYLLETLPNGDELRLIDCTNNANDFKIFAFLKRQYFVPTEQFVFVDRKITQIKRQYVSDFLYNTGFEPSEDELRQKLQDLEAQQRTLNESLESCGDVDYSMQIIKGIEDIGRERERITQFLNADKFVKTKVTFLHPDTHKELGIDIGDEVICVEALLYGLDIMGEKYIAVRKEFVIGKVLQPA